MQCKLTINDETNFFKNYAEIAGGNYFITFNFAKGSMFI